MLQLIISGAQVIGKAVVDGIGIAVPVFVAIRVEKKLSKKTDFIGDKKMKDSEKIIKEATAKLSDEELAKAAEACKKLAAGAEKEMKKRGAAKKEKAVQPVDGKE